MSFETITIYRDLPIKNGYVQIPPNDPVNNSTMLSGLVDAYFAEAGKVNSTKTIRLSLGSGRHTGSSYGQQEFLRLAGINPNTWYTEDPLPPLP